MFGARPAHSGRAFVRYPDRMPSALLIEDDLDILDTLEVYFRAQGFETLRATRGGRALEIVRLQGPDVIMLDLGLPDMDGLEVLRQLRAHSRAPVIVLTARVEEVDQLLSLHAGADDYVTKPFSPRVLMARAQALLRRTEQPVPEALRVGSLRLDLDAVEARVNQRPLALTAGEFRLLAHLARTPGRTATRAELLEAAFPGSGALERAVDVHMKNLRRKLSRAGAPELLRTVRGFGYRLDTTG